MRIMHALLVCTALFAATGAAAQKRDTLCFIQINDIYEISPLQGGKTGGIARIATVIEEHRKRYPTYTFVAGDFLNPSVMGTARVDNERLNGKQMVDMFNRIGVDYVTFGNHEFDIDEASLQKRIDESQFVWMSGNVQRSDGTPFYKNVSGQRLYFPKYVRIPSPNGQFEVGLLSLTLPSNTPPFSKFLPYPEALKASVPGRLGRRELLVGLTHLSMSEDMVLLEEDGRIRMLMGGHEHENMYHKSGNGFVAKADANGKTIYRHLIYRDGRKFTIDSKLIRIDESVPMEPAAAAAVRHWEGVAYESFRKSGFDPGRAVVNVTDTLNGMEASIRYRQNLLGQVVTEGLLMGGQADGAFINSGSIRIDDNVTGQLTELDIIRIMPFGGRVVEITMKGDLLNRILRTNFNRRGLGGYLQLDTGFSEKGNVWSLKGEPISDARTYRIRTIEFLTLGKELRLEFLNEKEPSVLKVEKLDEAPGKPLDVRMSLIARLKERYK